MDEHPQLTPTKTRYLWPWFLAAAVVLAVVLATFAILKEASRVNQQRQYQVPAGEK